MPPIMTEAGQDSSTADPFVVRKSTEETGGEFVRFEATLYPHPGKSASRVDLPHERWGLDNDFEHVNPSQDERFEVLSGKLRVVFDGEERTLTDGDEVTIPANVPHRHWNPTGDPARVIWERRPANRTEEWAESVYALAQAGKTDEDGVPGLLQLAVILDEYPDDTYPTTMPVGVQKALASILAPLGRAAGYEATHSREELDGHAGE